MNEWWYQAWITVQAEFSDLSDVSDMVRVLVRLLVAVVLGAVLGFEREVRGMAAGLRTHMLVSLGAALYVVAPLQGGMEVGDLSRVLQGVVAGIGFLGAGAILKLSERGEIKGLTTAASIWLTAAVGIAAGMGREMTAILTTVVALFILTLSHRGRGRSPSSD